MTVLPLLLIVAKKIHYWVREVAYNDMSLQAASWIPNEARVASDVRNDQPIKLDFAVPRKHRLNWISRTMNRLPY